MRKFVEADRLLGEGMELLEVWKHLEVSKATYLSPLAPQVWRGEAEDVKRLKELGGENAKLKRIVADQMLEVQALREIAKGESELVASAPGGLDAPGPPRCLGAAGLPDCRTSVVYAAA